MNLANTFGLSRTHFTKLIQGSYSPVSKISSSYDIQLFRYILMDFGQDILTLTFKMYLDEKKCIIIGLSFGGT